MRKNIAGYKAGSPWIKMGFTREMSRDLGWVGMVRDWIWNKDIVRIGEWLGMGCFGEG